MSLSSILVALVVGGGTLVFVLGPLLQPDAKSARTIRRGTARQAQALEVLWSEKQRVLREIRDLDFDYDMGKLGERVYEEQRVYLIRLAAAITQRIDALEREIAEQEARVEAAVAALRQTPPPALNTPARFELRD